MRSEEFKGGSGSAELELLLNDIQIGNLSCVGSGEKGFAWREAHPQTSRPRASPVQTGMLFVQGC